jgi:hypothetical protein
MARCPDPRVLDVIGDAARKMRRALGARHTPIALDVSDL